MALSRYDYSEISGSDRTAPCNPQLAFHSVQGSMIGHGMEGYFKWFKLLKIQMVKSATNQ
jgi:hypothetical protein